MEEQLQSLLDRIRSEGVERAQDEAASIASQAEERARRIVADAEAQADALRRKAEDDAAASVRRGEQALEQAARDFLLSLQRSVEAVLRQSLSETVAAALTPETMSGMLLRLAEAYAAHDMNESRVDVLLSPEDRDAVGDLVMEKYRELVRHGLTLRPDERTEAGFKVSFVDSSLYHDFTAEALADALAPVLKPALSDMVRRAAEEQA
jgi:V/A-type H+-transporting ATPase subunit E